jgi:glutathione S-transferase
VADAYLTTVLNWSMATPMIDFSRYPAVKDYLERMKKRPAVAKALAEEFELYKAEIARHKQAA